MISGQQTAQGDPTLQLLDPQVAGCCPEGILPFYSSSPGECCVEKPSENPYQ